ncbi:MULTISPECIES: AAA family ATPase [unclassified Bifidobacterium]|uniref:AAA family ATPase n=1 Tax=unclassified Bifidobacterium TaxID=2608897 RepID=UPI0011296FD9|nr:MULTISPECIES: AAA family ATPase [unclassified Bifidobacterium]
MHIDHFANVTNKSFKNYTSNEQLESVNILFGPNGSGKSSLAGWIYQNYNEQTCLFNTEYVQNNIQAVDEISGVAIQIGKQIQHEDEISKKEEEINRIKLQLEIANKAIANDRNLLYTKLDKVLQEGKRRFQTNRIKQKPFADSKPESAYEMWQKDISDKMLSSNDTDIRELAHEKKDNDTIIQHLKLVSCEEDRSLIEGLPLLLERQIPIPDKEISDDIVCWLRDGLQLHDSSKEEEACLFCGNKFNTIIVFKEIQLRIDSEHADMLTRLSKIKKTLYDIKEKIDSVQISNNKLKELFNNQYSYILSKIEEKEKHANNYIEANDDIVIILENINTLILKERQERSKRIEEIDKIFNLRESEAKSWIGKELSKDDSVLQLLSSINSQKTNIKALTSRCAEEKTALEHLKSEKNTTAAFAKLANDSLASLGATFHLEPSDQKDQYDVISEDGNIIKAADLSEGEMRLLAFLHYYYSLFESISNGKPVFRSELKVIVIDDPITSLDADNRFILTEVLIGLIDQVCKDNDVQLFIFTHSSLDFHNLIYRYRSSKNICMLLVTKSVSGDSEVDKLNPDEINNYSDYYRSTLKELFNFIEVPSGKVNSVPCAIQYANKMRFIIESHARTHYQIENVTANKKQIAYIENIYGITRDTAKQAFSSSLDVINALSHGLSFTDELVNEISPRAIQRAVRCIICILYNKDPDHILCMYGQSGQSNFKQKLQQWSSYILGM